MQLVMETAMQAQAKNEHFDLTKEGQDFPRKEKCQRGKEREIEHVATDTRYHGHRLGNTLIAVSITVS